VGEMKAVNIVEKLSDVINEKEEVFIRLKNSHNTDTEAMNDYRKLEKIADYAKEADTK
jgi:hypothetical protein